MPLGSLFSGEPLPVAPAMRGGDQSTRLTELEAFHRKLLDYLRRLGARLDQFAANPPEGGGSAATNVQAFAGFLDDDEATTESYSPVNWTRTLWKDTPYSHSNSPGAQIEVLVPGLYVISVDLLLLTNGFTNADVFIGFVDNGGALLAYPQFAVGRGDTPTISLCVSLPLPANTRITVFLKTDSPDSGGLLKSGSRITILRVRDNDSGGDSSSPGEGWNPTDGNEFPPWNVRQLDAIPILGTPAGWQFNHASNSGHALLATFD